MCVYIIINKQPNEMENIYYTSPKNDIFAVNQMFADGKAFKEIFIAIEKHSSSFTILIHDQKPKLDLIPTQPVSKVV